MNSRVLIHEAVYLPLFVQFFAPKDKDAAAEVWRYVNLGSRSRGDSLYRNLALSLRLLSGHPACGRPDPQWIKLANHIEALLAHDPCPILGSLGARAGGHDGVSLRPLFLWAKAMDEATPLSPRPEAFTAAQALLPRFAESAEVLVLSQERDAVVRRNLRQTGLLPYISAIDGQDRGPRAACLAIRSAGRMRGENALLIGDTIFDLELARASGLPFYPLMPSKENSSWEGLAAWCFSHFPGEDPLPTHGRLSAFLDALSDEAPWKRRVRNQGVEAGI